MRHAGSETSVSLPSISKKWDILILCRHNSSSTGSSAVAPSYSTSDNIKNIVTTLGLSRIATMILAGQPNRN